MVAVPSIGRAAGVDAPSAPPEAEATRDLYERYSARLYRFCFHQLGSREEAEDAVQTTFLNAFRGLQRGVEPRLESAWLYKIAENVCMTRRRSSVRRRRLEEPGDLDALQDVLPAPQQGRTEELHRLEEALAGMPEQQRKAILLREWQGLSYREIGEKLELSQAAVETLIFRARRSLAQNLERPETKRRVLRQGANVGSLIATFKTVLFGSSVAVKVAAVVVVTTTAAVVAEQPRHHARDHRAQVRPTLVRQSPAASAGQHAGAAPTFVTGAEVQVPADRAGGAAAGRTSPQPGSARSAAPLPRTGLPAGAAETPVAGLPASGAPAPAAAAAGAPQHSGQPPRTTPPAPQPSPSTSRPDPRSAPPSPPGVTTQSVASLVEDVAASLPKQQSPKSEPPAKPDQPHVPLPPGAAPLPDPASFGTPKP